MQLALHGAEHVPAAFSEIQLSALESALAALPADRAGLRLQPGAGLHALIEPATALARTHLGPGAQPVRAMLFNKTPESNWALGWHQDRTIAVRARADVPGFSQWTLKHGISHCVPPFPILDAMLTLRLHLDDTGEANAPLLIAPGSHTLGLIPEAQVPAVVQRFGTATCLAARGDLWLYAAALLHASERAAEPRRRRVLQLSYSAGPLPPPLEWLGL
jgi:ectoine hydroxylase-related dioxygenase (phytanoyl-CoA dioxygenase family)